MGQYEKGISKSFLRSVVHKIQETGTMAQLYELFIKYKPHIMDDIVASAFIDRLDVLEKKAISNYDSEKIEEFRNDIELERSPIQASNTKITKSTVTLSFNTHSGHLYQDCVRELCKMGIDKFKGQKATICAFLGMPVPYFQTLVKNDPVLKSYYDQVKQKNKKLTGV